VHGRSAGDGVRDLSMNYTFIHNGKEYSVELKRNGDNFTAQIGEVKFNVTNVDSEQNIMVFSLKDIRFAVYHARTGNLHYVNIAGENYVYEQIVGVSYKSTEGGGQKGNSVSSPMPGLVVKIPVAVGDPVEEGVVLAIVEAMKMQNELRAPRAGTVKKIYFKEGQQIDALKPIVELE